jgi:hypothetical protein
MCMLSYTCTSFIDCCLGEQKMLTLEPSRRITARTALEHEYFKDVGLIP